MTESEVDCMTKLVVIKDSEEFKYLYSLFLMETGRCQSVSNSVSNAKKGIQNIILQRFLKDITNIDN